MRIVFLSDDFPPQSFGGAGISTCELALGMKKVGHDVSVITTCRRESDAGESEYHGLKIYTIASDYSSRWRWYVSLYNPPVVGQVEELLAHIKPDVVSVNNVHQYLSYRSIKSAKRHARAVVFTARDVMTFNFAKLDTPRYLQHLDARTTWCDHLRQAGKRWNPLRNFFIQRYLAYADKVVAISESLKQALNQNGIGNVEVIYNGIDASLWAVDAAAVERFRMQHGLAHKKVLLFSGRLSGQKGGVKAIEALVLVAEEEPQVTLLVAGSADEFARVMQDYARQVGVGGRLVFTGWLAREEIKLAYAAADVVLMPSICLDTFGRVNIEAMAAQKPVVGTRFGGTPEVVVDGVTGYIVDPRHPEEIAEKTLDLLKNPAQAAVFGKAGYERVTVHFALEQKVAEHVALYTRLIKK